MNLNFFSMFSGIGAPEKALENMGIQYNLVGYSEIDKYASRSYAAIHGVSESMNLGDITKVDATKLPKDIDLTVYGFPCQDISNAGRMQGMFKEDGTQTRSGLFFEALRIIEETKPRVAIAENVKNLTSKRFANEFAIVLDSLDKAGYNNYWKVLNAKDFGIPQNRERVFIVSIRKDIDTGSFQFPEGFPLEKRLKDILEDAVDAKYYLSDDHVAKIVAHKRRQEECGRGFGAKIMTGDDIGNTVVTHPTKSSGLYLSVVSVGNVNPSGKGMNGNVISDCGLCSTLTTNKGEGPKILVREATKKGYAEAAEGDSVNLEQPNSTTRRGRGGNGVAQTLTTSCNQAVAVAMRGRRDDDGVLHQVIEISDREYANSITTVQKDSMVGLFGMDNKFHENEDSCQAVSEPNVLRQVRTEYGKEVRKAYESGEIDEKWGNMKQWEPRTDGVANTLSTVQKDNLLAEPDVGGLTLRKLTPKECFRLMGFDDESFHRAEAVNSNTRLYKQAGNSIAVPVIQHIIRNLVECGVLN